MNKLYKFIIPFLLIINLLSCSQSIENAQVFIATDDFKSVQIDLLLHLQIKMVWLIEKALKLH